MSSNLPQESIIAIREVHDTSYELLQDVKQSIDHMHSIILSTGYDKGIKKIESVRDELSATLDTVDQEIIIDFEDIGSVLNGTMQLMLRIVVLHFLLSTIIGVANELRVKGIRDLMIEADSLEELDILYKEICNCFNYNQFETLEEWQKIPESILNMTRDDIKTLIDLQMSKSKKNVVPLIKGDYNDMFCISKTKERFRVQGSTAVTWRNPGIPESYALKNLNIYDDDSGELVEIAAQTDYNTEFLIRLDDTFVLDVKPFLNFQYQNSPQPELFFDYVKYAALHTSIIDSTGIKQAINDWLDEVTPLVKMSPPQPVVKQKPELNRKRITFKNSETIEKVHAELKGYFPNKEAELLKALHGEQLTEILLFPHNQNKFVEVFKRLKYNGYLLSTPKETKDWICSTYAYQYQKGNKKEVRKFNTSTVHDILTKDKGEPTKNERICIVDWLPYKSHLKRQKEAENEDL